VREDEAIARRIGRKMDEAANGRLIGRIVVELLNVAHSEIKTARSNEDNSSLAVADCVDEKRL
jgi:hypothetical protein